MDKGKRQIWFIFLNFFLFIFHNFFSVSLFPPTFSFNSSTNENEQKIWDYSSVLFVLFIYFWEKKKNILLIELIFIKMKRTKQIIYKDFYLNRQNLWFLPIFSFSVFNLNSNFRFFFSFLMFLYFLSLYVLLFLSIFCLFCLLYKIIILELRYRVVDIN